MRRLLSLTLLLASILTPLLTWGSGTVFNATTTMYTIPDLAALRSSVYTIGCWGYLTGVGESNFGRMWASNDGPQIQHTTTQYRFVAEGFDTTNGIWSIPTPSLNVPHHLAVAYNGGSTANDPEIFLNGVLQTESEEQAPVGTYVHSSSQPHVLGNLTTAAATYDGTLASCFYYNRMLTAAEVTALMHCGPGAVPNGLLGYWPLGEFGPRNYTSTTGLDATEGGTIAINSTFPPVNASQGGTCHQ